MMETIKQFFQSLSGGDGVHGLLSPLVGSPLFYVVAGVFLVLIVRNVWNNWKGK